MTAHIRTCGQQQQTRRYYAIAIHFRHGFFLTPLTARQINAHGAHRWFVFQSASKIGLQCALRVGASPLVYYLGYLLTVPSIHVLKTIGKVGVDPFISPPTSQLACSVPQ